MPATAFDLQTHRRADEDPAHGFPSLQEYLDGVMRASGARAPTVVEDSRLRRLAQADPAASELAFLLPRAFTPHGIRAAAGSDEQGGYADRWGGFARPTATLSTLLGVGIEGDPTAGRTLPIPMDEPRVEIPARTDKDHSTSVSGGLILTRKPETVDATSSRMEMEQVVLYASTLMGLTFATEELASITPRAFTAILAAGFRDELGGHLLKEKIRGNGGTEFLGALNSSARVTVAKEGGQAAATIQDENVLKMAERMWGYDRAIWLANHDTRRQLAACAIEVGTTGVVPLYVPARSPDLPDMLWGRPIFFTEFCSTLGDEGDLMCVNWSQYLEGLYQPLQSAESVHVRYERHERAFKFWLRNAGAPWWRSELTPANGANTLSPIVTLAERA